MGHDGAGDVESRKDPGDAGIADRFFKKPHEGGADESGQAGSEVEDGDGGTTASS